MGATVPLGEAFWPLAVVANAATVARPNKINGFVFIAMRWTRIVFVPSEPEERVGLPLARSAHVPTSVIVTPKHRVRGAPIKARLTHAIVRNGAAGLRVRPGVRRR